MLINGKVMEKEMVNFIIYDDIAIDINGFVYVGESDNSRIQKFTPDGQFLEELKLPMANSKLSMRITFLLS